MSDGYVEAHLPDYDDGFPVLRGQAMNEAPERTLGKWLDGEIEQADRDCESSTYIEYLRGIRNRVVTLEQERDEFEKKLWAASDDLAFLDKVRRENVRLREAVRAETDLLSDQVAGVAGAVDDLRDGNLTPESLERLHRDFTENLEAFRALAAEQGEPK